MAGTDQDPLAKRRDDAVIASAVLTSLAEVGDPLRRRLCKLVEWPEAAVNLDIESRRPDLARMVKHVHQSCEMHAGAYLYGTEMKVVHLIDAFEQLAQSGNGLGLYPVARSALELRAQVLQVSSKLFACQQKVSAANWLPPSEEYFATIVRARFATSNAKHREALLSQGASSRALKPMSVTESIRLLSASPAGRGASDRYNELCDAVHHNLSSTAAVTSGAGESDVARVGAGKMIFAQGQVPIVSYQYPVVWKADTAISSIGGHFVDDIRQTLDALQEMPSSPLGPGFLERVTGSPLGVVSLQRRPDGTPIRPPARVEKQRRNGPCVCGSGRKNKQCCGT
jgi:hypothetical protein